MFVLHDRTRRFWTLVLFLTGGPLLTLIVLTGLWLRNGIWAVQSEQANFSRFLSVPVIIEGVRYIRPSEQILFGMALQDPKNNQTTIYCPVVSLVQHRGTSKRPEFDSHPAAKLDKINDLTKKDIRVMATIPLVCIRYSSLPRLKFLLNEFLQQTTETIGQRVVLFDIKEIFIFYSDADFQQKCGQGQGLSRSQRWSQGQSLLSASREKTKAYETVDASVESIQQWMKKYNELSSGAQLANVIGLYQGSQKKRRIDLEFRFAQIPAERSTVFSWEFVRNETKKDSGISRMALRNDKSQMPCSFASMFCPFFFIAGTESWMTGTITAETTCSNTSESDTLYQFNDFHLKYCDIAPLAKRITTRDVSGTVADFYLESAQVQQGVFTGKGLLFLVDGAMEKKFLGKLAETIPLRFDPASTLANQYKNDEVPFNQLAISFDFKPEGVFFNSSYPKKIVAFFRNETTEYGVYLREDSDRNPVRYPQLAAALAMQPDVVPFWSPVYRRAINHLPVEP